jgi:tripartite-type tricarboxylate transporter receptor subunit TctC
MKKINPIFTAPAPVVNGRRRVLLGAGALAGTAAAAALGLPRQARAWAPSRPVTLMVPWPAGGATDISLRVLAELATPHLGRQVVIENRGGAGGTMAMPVLQTAEPDGHTIAQLPYPVFRIVHTQKVLWDPIRDTTPILQVSGVTFGALVAAGSRFRRFGDLLEFARQRPGELSIATNGVGTTPHVVLETLFSARGLKYIHVPYKGTAEQLNAIISGQVMAGINSTGFAPAVDNGQLRLLATFGEQRSRRWSQVPTLRELGYPVTAVSPWGLAGPRGLPAPVLDGLHQAFKKAMFEPAFATELAKYDQDLDYLGPADYARVCREFFEHERLAVERMGLMRNNTPGS